MTNEELEKVAELVAVICKDRYLRQKLVVHKEFVNVALMIAPHMDEVMKVLAQRYNNVKEEA